MAFLVDDSIVIKRAALRGCPFAMCCFFVNGKSLLISIFQYELCPKNDHRDIFVSR